MNNPTYPIFRYFLENHKLTLTDEEIFDIIDLVHIHFPEGLEDKRRVPGLAQADTAPEADHSQDILMTNPVWMSRLNPACDEACFYHCTKGGAQFPECIAFKIQP